MGSTSTRKPSDTVRIKPAQQTKSTQGNGEIGIGGSPGGEKVPDINNLCPIRFRVKLTRQNIDANIDLTLDEHTLTASGIGEVGEISTRTAKRLQTCLGLGINYITIITVVDRGICYAEFSQ